MYAYDHDASLSLNAFEGQSAAGTLPTYTFTYSPTPGATMTALQSSVDIKPGETPNSINPKSKGVIPVAILSTDTFDATTVDPFSVEFGPNGANETHEKGHIEDINGDGKLDMMLHFKTQDTGIVSGDTACLTGKTTSGFDIGGCDLIQTVQ